MYTYKSIADTIVMLDSDNALGLSEPEAEKRLAENGTNQIREAPKKSLPAAFLEQLADPLIYVLLAASAISILLGEISDAVIILAVVLMNAAVGLIQEGKAQRALESLKKLTAPKAWVIRGGKQMEIPAENLVKGDVVFLEAGGQVPADLRVIESHSLKIEESALTGESVPVEKGAEALSMPRTARGVVKAQAGAQSEVELPPLGERRNMAFMSTIVTYGRGRGIVTGTGMDTEIGKIAALIAAGKQELTPLQRRLGDLGKILSFLSLGLCVGLFVIAIFQKRDIFEMLITAISLAVAAVPEGLPAVVTICLALSVTRMVRVNTIVRRLPSVETLGAVSVVCSDKTGTLTQNKMTVTCCYQGEQLYSRKEINGRQHQELLRGMTLCNDAVLSYDSKMGDPTELALLELAEDCGMHRQELERKYPRIHELAFDSKRKMMSTCHNMGEGSVSYTKGAPDEILKRCTHILMGEEEVPITAVHREQIGQALEELAGQALRTLALARKTDVHKAREEGLAFVGFVGMKDPARPEAAAAVKDFKEAGVSTVMITGDHVDTAFAIASQLGIVHHPSQCMTGEEIGRLSREEWKKRLETTRVFARVSPEHKVKIVRGFQETGNIVAMTGDGVNDAPSLKAADVGIAMGMNGTDVAKQASDIILTDDNFATIRKAIEEGRGVYENIKKTVIFLLSSNLGEIMTMFVAVLLGLAAPLKSSHILWINLITDSLPALALGTDKNDGKSLMKCSPRSPKESLFAGGGLACTCFYGCLIAAISLTAFFLPPFEMMRQQGQSMTLEHFRMMLQQKDTLACAQTYAFTVLGMSQLFHAVGMRDIRKSVFRMNHRENRLMLLALAAGFGLQFLVTEQPFLIAAFGTVHLSLPEWGRLLLLAAFPLLAHEIMAFLHWLSEKF